MMRGGGVARAVKGWETWKGPFLKIVLGGAAENDGRSFAAGAPGGRACPVKR